LGQFSNPDKGDLLIVISKKSQYALIAMTCLAREYEHGPVLVSRMAEEEQIPKDFLNLILLELKNRGLVQSKRGKRGGYALSRPPEEIDLATILRLIGGPLAPVPCASGSAPAQCNVCRDEEVCAIKPTMREVRDATARILERTMLSDLVRRGRELEAAKRARAANPGPPADFVI
jgi:Rrf2 family protein